MLSHSLSDASENMHRITSAESMEDIKVSKKVMEDGDTKRETVSLRQQKREEGCREGGR